MGAILDHDVILTSLSSGKPNEQRELLSWLAAKLPGDPQHVAVKSLVKPVFACLEDRSAEVRKSAQDLTAVLAHM